jgi:hypothetical protein
MSDDFLTMTENQVVSDKTPTSGYNYPDMEQVYDPNNYTSITKTSIINKENPSGIPLAKEDRFGIVTAGEGLQILRDGFIALNLGYGFSIDARTKKLILSAEIYPIGGFNINVETLPSGVYTVNAVGENELEPLSNRIPTSKAIADYTKTKTGNIEELNSSLTTEGNNLTNAVNALYTQSHYYHTQITPQATWVINHPLKKRPSVTIATEDNITVFGEVEYPSLNQVIVRFSAGFSGSAFLN